LAKYAPFFDARQAAVTLQFIALVERKNTLP
jgi:hypothetical protein